MTRGSLGDPRVLAFISHMGQNSHVEAAFAGKPTIAIPLFGDQGYNAGCALRNGISTTFPKSEIDEERLTNALREILGNSRWLFSIQLTREQLATQVSLDIENELVQSPTCFITCREALRSRS